MKALILHLGLTAVSAVTSLMVMSRGEEPILKQEDRVDVWPGPPEALTSITYESKTAKVRIEARKDALGRYFVINSDKEESTPSDPHGSGAPQNVETKERKQRSFISAKSAEDLVGKLAPLRAFRAAGKLDASKLSEFSLDPPEATLKVMIGGQEYGALVGGAAIGGVERYVKHLGTGEVYAIPSELSQTALYAENRLMEHDLHVFNMDEVTRIRISKGNKAREIVRVKDRRDGWADLATPTKLDETVGNWMSKVGWFRALEFVEKPSANLRPEDAVLRLEYFAGDKNFGFLELYKLPGTTDYLARSEYSRWYVKVAQVAGEQVENDLNSVLK